MKTLIFILSACTLFLCALPKQTVAQIQSSAVSTLKGTTSNLTNAITFATSDTMNIEIKESWNTLVLSVRKNTGATTALTGTAVLYGAVDGSDTYTATGDTILITAIAAPKSFTRTMRLNLGGNSNAVYPKLRLITTGGGTGTGTLTGSIIGRRY